MKEIRENKEIEELLIKTNALLEGHFQLSSGLHSNRYVQCARFFQYPEYACLAANQLASLYEKESVDVVIGGAFGGITIAYELAHSFGVRGIFAERLDGKFTLRRGFELKPGERVMIAEDVITTGKSILEVMELVKEHGGELVGIASLIDRNMDVSESIDARIEWLVSVEAKTYEAKNCPMCRDGVSVEKPGSRFYQKS